MNWRRAVGEGISNALANLWLLVFVVVQAALSLATPALWEMRYTHNLYAYQQDLLNRGYYTMFVSPMSGGMEVDAGECHQLRQARGVVASGGATNVQAASWWNDRGPRQTAWAVDRELVKLVVLARASDPALSVWKDEQIIVDESAAKQIPITSESVLSFLGDDVAGSVGVQQLSILGSGFHSGAIWPTVQSKHQVCILLVEAEYRQQLFVALRTAYINFAEVSWALPGVDYSRDPIVLFDRRLSQFGWLISFSIWTAVSLLFARLRRADVGLYLILGATRSSTALMVWSEASLATLLGGVPAVLLVLGMSRYFPNTSTPAVLASLLYGVSTMMIGSVLGALTVAWSDVDSLLRDR